MTLLPCFTIFLDLTDDLMILKELYNQCRTPDLIVNGAKLSRVETDGIIFKDSLAFLPFPLAAFPLAFAN